MTFDEFQQGMNGTEQDVLSYMRGIAMRRQYHAVLEIGSGWGIFARCMLELDPSSKLTTIDKIASLPAFEKNTAGYEDRIRRITAEARNALTGLQGQFDLIYVDGSHNRGDVFEDLKLAWPLLGPGGLMILDDCLHRHNFDGDYGVMQDLGDFLFMKRRAGEKIRATIIPMANGYVELEKID